MQIGLGKGQPMVWNLQKSAPLPTLLPAATKIGMQIGQDKGQLMVWKLQKSIAACHKNRYANWYD